MFLRRAVALPVVSTLLFALIGGGVGVGLGVLNPAYYRSVCRDGKDPDFDPVAFGVGAGVSQGAAGGAVVGLLLVATHLLVATPRPAGRSLGRRLLTGLAVLTVGGGCLGSTFLAGLFRGTEDVYASRYWRERELVESHLRRDPAFTGLRVERLSGDQGFFLDGRVPTDADRVRLRELVVRLFGEYRERDIMAGVAVGAGK